MTQGAVGKTPRCALVEQGDELCLLGRQRASLAVGGLLGRGGCLLWLPIAILPTTSFDGLFWGFKMSEAEGDKKNQGGKRQRNRRKKRPNMTSMSCGGDFYNKTGEVLRF